MTRVVYNLLEDGIGAVHMKDTAGNNKFSQNFVNELLAALAEAGRDQQARVCILMGLPNVFCGGADLKVLRALLDGGVDPYDLTVARAVLELTIPTIAAMQGHAIGGGLTIGVACDIVVLARESRYGANFMDLGFTPGMGTTGLLESSMGVHLAAEMMYGGRLYRGSELAGRALVNYIEPRADVPDRALDLARCFAEKPRGALSLLKRAMSLSKRQAFEHARTLESFMHEICFALPETQARIEEYYLRSPSEDDDVD